MADLAMPKSTSNTRTTTLGPRPTFPEQHAEPAPIAHDRHIPSAPGATLHGIEQGYGYTADRIRYELAGYGGIQANVAFGGAA